MILCLTFSLASAGADLILHNGKIITVDSAFSIHQAVAISGHRITAVGSDQAILTAEKGPHTRLLDLQGKAVLPGLIDSHVHTLSAGLSEFRAPLPPLDSFAAVQDYIRKQARKTPPGRWIIVPRTFPTRLKEMRMPTREVLDVAPDHPVMFDASYTVVVNSKALEISGITDVPTGILKNAQSRLKGLNTRDGFTPEEKLQAMEQMLQRYVAAGLTAVGDRAVSSEDFALFQKLQSQKRLPLRVVMTWRPTGDVLQQLRSAPYTTNTGDDWLKFGAFKQTLDGGMTIGTAYQRHPYGPFGKQLYGHTDPDDRGQLFIPPARLLEIMTAARDRGWQLTTHDQGGGAIDVFLDTLEALDRAKSIAPTRSHLMHASFQSPAAIQRAAKLGVLADVQAPWLYHDGPALEKVFGPEGMRYFFPLRSYIDAGVIFAAGSDHMIGFDKTKAVNPYNPFLSLWTQITRQTDRGTVIHPEERITRQEALKSHTIWAAHLQFAEKQRGSIEPNKLADLVVIDRDYLTCPQDQIKIIQPVMTILDGKIVSQLQK